MVPGVALKQCPLLRGNRFQTKFGFQENWLSAKLWKKNSSPFQRGTIFKNGSLRGSFWLHFFSQCMIDLHLLYTPRQVSVLVSTLSPFQRSWMKLIIFLDFRLNLVSILTLCNNRNIKMIRFFFNINSPVILSCTSNKLQQKLSLQNSLLQQSGIVLARVVRVCTWPVTYLKIHPKRDVPQGGVGWIFLEDVGTLQQRILKRNLLLQFVLARPLI